MLCAPCQVCTNANKLGDSGFLHCLLFCFLPCLPICLQRGNVRQRYEIYFQFFFLAFYAFFQEWCWFFFLHRNGYSGDACEDCLVASCFPCCASIQIANELDQMGTTRNGQAPIVTTQITINNPAPVQAPTVQVPYVPVAQAPIVQVPYGQAPPPPYKY